MKKIIALLLAAAICMMSGCLFQTGEELYSLPQPPDEYIELQNIIEGVLASGAEYSAPTSGTNRQSVQLRDLDGDGVEEAIAFLKNAEDSKPLKIYIFRMTDQLYETKTVIEGDGSSIDSINYVDLNGDGSQEIIVGWKVSEDITKALSIYDVSLGETEELTTVNYSKYTVGDWDEDGQSEVAVMRLGDDSQPAVAECLDYTDGKISSVKTNLSMGITGISKVKFGKLNDGVQALYISSYMDTTSMMGESALVTDVLVKRGGKLTNITLEAESSVSTAALRGYAVYTADTDGDGVIEIPRPELFPGGGTGSEDLLKISWWSTDSNRNIAAQNVTCHDFTDGWYLLLPDGWSDDITVLRTEGVNGQATVTVCRYNGTAASPTPMLRIISSPKESVKSTIPGTIIATTGKMTYSYETAEAYSSWSEAISQEELFQRFNTIESEWASVNIW